MLGPEVEARVGEIFGELDRTTDRSADVPRAQQVLADPLGDQIAEEHVAIGMRRDHRRRSLRVLRRLGRQARGRRDPGLAGRRARLHAPRTLRRAGLHHSVQWPARLDRAARRPCERGDQINALIVQILRNIAPFTGTRKNKKRHARAKTSPLRSITTTSAATSCGSIERIVSSALTATQSARGLPTVS